jgi:hypothetical protein
MGSRDDSHSRASESLPNHEVDAVHHGDRTQGLGRCELHDDCVAPGLVAWLRHRIFDGIFVGVEWSNDQVRGP